MLHTVKIAYMNWGVSIIAVLLLTQIFMGCCKKNKSSKIASEIESYLTVVSDSAININEGYRVSSLPYSPFNLNDIKKIYERYFTSGIIPNSENKIFKKPTNHKGFFGGYSLTTDNNDLVGALTVFASGNPWNYYNNTDIFIEICTVSDEVILWDKIKVGMPVDKLKEILGEPQIEDSDYLIYKKNNNLIALFKYAGSNVIWLRVGYYNDEFWIDIDSQWQTLATDYFL